ncbi:hypothetical protein VNI00_018185 [Paramarasmius palmivorus]|uniref:F-box domain-containing protein n=1 Tax=Paramarasmius palmivorus TaxID=297713 RepID=A0AAW0B0N1_9AGAR
MNQITIDHATTTLRLQPILSFYQDSPAPLARIPTEILILIFEFCVQSDTSGHSLSRYAMPFVLSQVCRRWRMIATSAPSLWQNIQVLPELLVPWQRFPPSNRLRLWLDRSYPLPITCLALLDSPELAVHNAELLDVLMAHSARWFTMDFTFGEQSDLFYQLCSQCSILPQLSCFRVEVKIEDGGIDATVPTSWIAPNLKDAVLLVQTGSMDVRHHLSLPWSQLEDFEGIFCTPKPFLDISPNFTHLRRCCLQISQHFDIPSLSYSTLLSLRHFEISGPYLSIVLVLNRLSLPALQILDVDPEEQIGPVADALFSLILRLQTRSSFRLHSFSTPFSLFSSTNSLTMAKSFASIQELRILLSHEEETGTSIYNLAHAEMFPNLRALHLLFREMSDEDYSLFARMVDVIDFRRKPRKHYPDVVPLEEVSVDVIRDSDGPQLHIPTHTIAFRTLLKMQGEGLVLLGKVVRGEWYSYFGDTRWSEEDLEQGAQWWARFGYNAWLFDPEIAAYVERKALEQS